jgi:hypothetical protein
MTQGGAYGAFTSGVTRKAKPNTSPTFQKPDRPPRRSPGGPGAPLVCYRDPFFGPANTFKTASKPKKRNPLPLSGFVACETYKVYYRYHFGVRQADRSLHAPGLSTNF